MEQALSDMKVLDLTHHIAGPYCTKLLADYGADVIKIERPGSGDPSRRMGPFPDDIPHPEKSGLFLHLNTNKRSITLNLKTNTAQHIFKELVKDVDVVVENFRPGVMASFGLDYPVIEEINPKVVMASISNFGQTGPYRDFKSSELVLSAMGGGMSFGLADREPVKYAGNVRQYQAGLLALDGILAAFYASSWYGVGQYLDLSMMEMTVSNFDSRASGLVRYQFTGQAAKRSSGAVKSPNPPLGIYPCADGFMCWYTVGPRWHIVARCLQRPDLLTDPRFATPDARIENSAAFEEIFLAWSLQRTKQQCWQEGVAAGMLCGPCNTVAELMSDPHIRERGFWADVEHPALGRVNIPGRPFVMTKTPWQLRRSAPLLGQHNEEVLGGLGYAPEDMVKLRETGVI